MRLVFAGTPEPAVPALRALLESPRHEVVAVITRPDAPRGRGRHSARSPIGALADQAGIEVLTPARPSEPDFLARLAELAPDCCPVVAYGALVPPSALAVPRYGWVNLHFSLLPAWRGAAPVQAALRAGDEITGATTFLLEQGLDTGPTYGVVTEAVRPDDTAGALLGRLAGSGAGLLLATLDGIADGSLLARPQPVDGISHAPKVTTDDARVDWSAPATAVDRLIRATTPDPGAWSTFRDARIGLGPVTPVGGSPVGGSPVGGGPVGGSPAGGAGGGAAAAGPAAGAGAGGARGPADLPELEPGELHVQKRRVLVGTATGPVQLGEVRAPGKRPMPAPDWARGVRIEAGELLA